jgi:hypothetical protein
VVSIFIACIRGLIMRDEWFRYQVFKLL